MRVALRGIDVGPTDQAALTRATRDAFAAAGCRVEMEPLDPGGPLVAGDVLDPDTWSRPATPPDVHVQVVEAGRVDPEVAGRIRVALVSGQLEGLSIEAVGRLRAMDEVWVTDSRIAARAVACGLERDQVWFVPEPIDLDAVASADRADIPGTRGSVVLAMLEWSTPWGWDALLAAWAQAFGPSNAVTLVIAAWAPPGQVFSGADAGTAVMSRLVRLGTAADRLADMVLLADPLDAAGRAGLIAASDVVVDPGRGGVLRRPAREALAAGKAVVGPGLAATSGWHVAQRFVPRSLVAEAGSRISESDPMGLAVALRAAVGDPLERERRGECAQRACEFHDHRAIGGAMLVRLADLASRTVGPTRPPRPRVVLAGSMFGAHSLAGVNRGFARSVLRSGALDLTLRNAEGVQIDPSGPVDPTARSLVWGCSPRAGRADVEVRHGHPADLSESGARRLVSILNWEFGGAPTEWIEALDGPIDETWVLTDYVRDGWIVAGADPERVHVVPAGVDPRAFHPKVRPMELGPEAPGYRFLFLGGLAWRKGVDLLVEAYRTAFTRDDNVTLVMKDFGPGGPYLSDGTDRLVDELVADPSAPRVLRLTGTMTEDEIPGLYAACDCLVHPYRAEAYGMTMVEAMACGKPVIAPDLGAARAFMNCETALLVPARRVELDVELMAGYRVSRPPVVHEVDVAAMAQVMRWAYENHGAAAVVGGAASKFVREHHTWDRATQIMVRRLRAITSGADAQMAEAA
jgi:glycosyltransferase involved in cell wall biosynthesis